MRIVRGWGRLTADGSTVLANGEIRIRGTTQRSTNAVHVDVKTLAGYTRVAIDLDSGDIVAFAQGHTSKEAYERLLATLDH